MCRLLPRQPKSAASIGEITRQVSQSSQIAAAVRRTEDRNKITRNVQQAAIRHTRGYVSQVLGASAALSEQEL